ncbi:copper resistance protein B [Qipengyuania flava]|uniref:copper resistance protein B n=1 Tax=Qipengyuania flava TaxID=192812 RepID=UPI001C63AD64|nr:copper resistance protein B [Qipengyuania flava]QYJ08121.1 copper resistance protein B [Qipengyuania flava]
MRALLLAAAALTPGALAAQDHSGHGGHAGHAQHAPAAEAPEVHHCAMGHLSPEKCPPKGEDKAAPSMDHSTHGAHGQDAAAPPRMDHSGMDHSAHGAGADKSAPDAAPESAVPARAFEGPRHAADAVWGAEAMEPSRRQLAKENGGMRTGMVLVERLEARIDAGDGEDGYLWDAQAWYGGDVNRLVLKTEGEGEFGGAVEDAEIQALYSRAIGPFFDLQAGIRLDPIDGTRGYAVVGVQGLAPYMFHVDGALFLSDQGDLTARVEAEYDQKITQQLILQPRIEIEASAQDIPARGIGAGFTKIEPGLRLRYEFVPEFAPYIGVEYEAKLGETADIARLAGEDPDGFKLLIGLRAWF